MKKILFLATLVFILFACVNLPAEQTAEESFRQFLANVKNPPPPPPADFSASGITKCFTSFFLEYQRARSSLSADLVSALDDFSKRPRVKNERTYDTPSGNFKIHYASTDSDAVYQANVDLNVNGIPDYVENCGAIFDHIWDVEINSLGFRIPASDGFIPDSVNGGDGRYDVYFLNMANHYGAYYEGVVGFTVPESLVAPDSIQATSFLVLWNDYTLSPYFDFHTPLDWVRVTGAHEFFHAVQLAYDAFEQDLSAGYGRPYWMELTSTWMEDMVYTDVNDYRNYLWSFFQYPELSLKTFLRPGVTQPNYEYLHPYASCVWGFYLSKKFGVNTIKEIWELCGEIKGDNVLPATQTVLTNKGSTFENAFQEFTVWNYFAGRANSIYKNLFYSEGDSFGTTIRVRPEQDIYSYDTVKTIYYFPYPQELSAGYIRFSPPQDISGGLEFNFFSADNIPWRISRIGFPRTDVDFDIQVVSSDQILKAETKVCPWSDFEHITMVVATPTFVNADYIFWFTGANIDTANCVSRIPANTQFLPCYPNPLILDGSGDTLFFPIILSGTEPGEIISVRIDLFTLAGEKVKTITANLWPDKWISRGPSLPFWVADNEDKEKIVSGVYLCHIQTKNASTIQKVAVIRK
jgi:hypothetical protein